MFPEPPSLLPVIPRKNLSVSLGKAAKIFSYCVFSLPLTLAVLRRYYFIQDPDFYLEYFEVRNV
jgi:hypothetical protein